MRTVFGSVSLVPFDLQQPVAPEEFAELDLILHAHEFVEFEDTFSLQIPLMPDCDLV